MDAEHPSQQILMNNVSQARTNVKSAPKNTIGEQRRRLSLVPALADYVPSSALTDAGNATRLLERHGNDIRYVPAWKSWLIWNGQKWEKDELGRAWLFGENTLKKLYTSAGESDDSDERKTLAKFAISCESEKRIKSMLSLAEKRPGVPVRVSDLDADQMLLNCANGTINLVLGSFKAANPEDLITKQSDVEYQPGAQCPTWISFLDKIFAGNQDLINFMQRVIGYCLTGLTIEQSLFILYGGGGNGKSTLLDVIMKLMGEYGLVTPANTLLAKKSDAPSYDIAQLAGVRFVSASETDQDKKLAEGTVKSLTGDKTVTARLLYGNPFRFNPLMKIFLATNNKPTIVGQDYGIWRRVKLIPFNVTIPESEKDPELYDKLLEELSGILNWAIQGCLDWQSQGLNPPQEVLQATQQYKNEQDVLNQFLEEECILASSVSCTAKELYACYCKWNEENGEKPDSQKRFGAALIKKDGIDRYKSGTYYYSGIRPRKDDDYTPPPAPERDEKKITRVGGSEMEFGRLDDLDDSSESRTRSNAQDTSLLNSVQIVQSSTEQELLPEFAAGQQVNTPEGRGQVERVSSLGVYINVGGSTKRYTTTAQIARIELLQE
jgi:putative DNA primase/helicase